MNNNIDFILATDSYKLNHWNQYPHDTEAVYSYFESRPGAKFNETVFFGLQAILKEYLEGEVVTEPDVDYAAEIAKVHFGNDHMFNDAGWRHICKDHGGHLPLKIKAVPEGTPVPTGNVLMTVENTCPECYWLTNAVESLLTHVWYPSTVATLSRETKKMIKGYLDWTADSDEGLPFMLHDFGYRGVTSHESAEIGGAAHLVNFKGTDTLPGMILALEYYDADINDLAFSVPATEHSVMTARGKEGEHKVVEQLLEEYPTGILSVVADSYDIYRFVEDLCDVYREDIFKRDGVFVVRPDSCTKEHSIPEALVEWIAEKLWESFGGRINRVGYKVLDSHIRILWGDGIDYEGIKKILNKLAQAGFSAENFVFGMGGGLLQKINRDTQRFAFKCSAQRRAGEWFDIQKTPLDASKLSKKGRLRLAQRYTGELVTLGAKEVPPFDQAKLDVLQTVFENGKVLNPITFAEVRANAEL